MRTILGLFGRSPFVPIKSHMEMISSCVHLLVEEIQAVEDQVYDRANQIANEINEKQQIADTIKREILNGLGKNFFLAINRSNLIDILNLQSDIAERCHDAAIILVHKKTTLPEFLREEFHVYFSTLIRAFSGAEKVIYELNDLLETSFGGIEAEKVKQMINTVAFEMAEAENIKRKLISLLLNAGEQLSYSDFYVWEKCIRYLSGISHISANLGFLVGTTLDLK